MPDFSYKPQVYEGPSYEKLEGIKKQHVVQCIRQYYKKPLVIHEGRMQWLYDTEGRRYLDMFGGIVTVSVGHCHPKINEVVKKQMDKLWHTTNIYMHPKLYEYAEKLVAKFPGKLKVVYLVNSGSEANDLAMLLARIHTKNHDIISFRNAYHGMSPYVMGITAHSTWRFDVPVNNGIHHAMNPDVYRGWWGGQYCRDSPVQTDRECGCSQDHCQAGDNYYSELEQVFRYSLPRGKVAGFFAESIQGVGGVVQYPKGFLKKAFELVRSNGGVCISDEVQTGFGRLGSHFWGFETHEVVPDIVTLAKGIGNGYPLAAVITTPRISEALNQALHFNTYGGNPIACTVGLSVLEVIEEEGLQKNSADVGTHLLNLLAPMREEFPCVGDVRGKGLMIGMELITDKESKAPLGNKHFADIWEDCKDMGVLIGRGGLMANVIRLKPPMCVTKQDADFTAEVLRKAFQNHTRRMKLPK
ncbi:alanine--glyoxylate aminotransferase 2, mitochondrial isoform X2 [Macrosteles quadrilineatus]|nr:alanine--glyoxylate aminotransferase 2, mitochondrial isoform X2 [Macrosteles quadrilineatus]